MGGFGIDWYINCMYMYLGGTVALQGGGGWGLLSYMGDIFMCCCEGYGFQAVYMYSSMGYVNQNIWV